MQDETTVPSNDNKLVSQISLLNSRRRWDNQNLKTKFVYLEVKATVRELPLQCLLPTTSPSTSEVLINGELKEEQLTANDSTERCPYWYQNHATHRMVHPYGLRQWRMEESRGLKVWRMNEE